MKRILILCFIILPLALFSQVEILSVSPSDLIKVQSNFILVKTSGTRFDLFAPTINLGNGINILSTQVLAPGILSVEAFVLNTALEGTRDLELEYRGEIVTQPDAVSIITAFSDLSLSLHLMPFEVLHISDFDPANPQLNPLLFNVTFYNDQNARNVKLRFLLNSIDYGEIALSEKTYNNLQPNELVSLSNRDFTDYYINGQSDKFLKKSGETALLPSGEYEFIVAIIDDLDSILIVDEQSVFIENNIPDIDIIGPGNPMDESPAEIQNGSPFFQWFSSGYSFDFTLVEVTDGQSAAEDVMTNNPVYTVKSISDNYLNYPAFAELLEKGKTYAWQITSYYLGSLGTIAEHSEVYWFSILKTDPGFLLLEQIKIVPSKLVIETNQSFQFKAIGMDRDGNEVPLNCDWEVVPQKQGWINSNGLFQAGNKAVPVQIKASWGNLTSEAIVIITNNIPQDEPDISSWIDQLFGFTLSKDVYVSRQTGEFSSIEGENRIVSRLYESMDLDFSASGPILWETFPEYLIAEPNSRLKAIGVISPDLDSIAEAGRTYQATLKTDYDITFALPSKSSSAAILDSFICVSSAIPNEVDSFQIFHKIGRLNRDINIHSIWAEITEITLRNDSLICVSKGYPDQGEFKWNFGDMEKVGKEVSFYPPTQTGQYTAAMTFNIGEVSYHDTALIQVDTSQLGIIQLSWNSILNHVDTNRQQNLDLYENMKFELSEIQQINNLSIISPRSGDSIVNGELLIVCEVNPRIKLDPSSVQIFIASAEVSSEVKVNGHTISALFATKIPPDLYDIDIRFRDVNKQMYYKRWAFFIVEKMDNKPENKSLARNPLEIKTGFSGRLSASSKFTNVSGSDAYLRQEPAQLHHVKLDGKMNFKKFNVPLKLYLNNQESSMLPYRNRFMTGFETKSFKLHVGDFNSYFHKQVLYGQQIRGVNVYYKRQGMEISYAKGEIVRAVEGTLNAFVSGQGFPPSNLQMDSTFVIGGFYKRKVSVLNLKFSSIDNTKFNIVFLKSTDDTNSIKYGGYAGQNFVFGASNQVRSRNNIFQADFGVALSMTTDDIRKGVYSKYEIDELFGSDIPFYPENLKWLIVMNSTTKPLTWNNRPPLAVYGKAKLNILKQHFYFNIDRIGSAYYSFGNPYLQNDRLKFKIEDRIPFWKKKANLTFSYTNFQNNLSKIESITKTTQIGNAKLNFRYSPKWPVLMASYKYYLRDEMLLDGTNYQNNGIQNASAGANYSFKTASVKHHIALFYNYYLRLFSSSNLSNQTTHSFNFNLSEQLPYNISFSVYYQSFVQTIDTTDLSIQNSFGFSLGWRTKDEKIRFMASSNSIKNNPTLVNSTSFRQVHRLEITWLILEQLSFTAEAGYGAFESQGISSQFYEEYWGLVRLNYVIR